MQTLVQGHSVLIFCPNKQWCERLSQRIAHGIRTIGSFKTYSNLLPIVNNIMDIHKPHGKRKYRSVDNMQLEIKRR